MKNLIKKQTSKQKERNNHLKKLLNKVLNKKDIKTKEYKNIICI